MTNNEKILIDGIKELVAGSDLLNSLLTDKRANAGEMFIYDKAQLHYKSAQELIKTLQK